MIRLSTLRHFDLEADSKKILDLVPGTIWAQHNGEEITVKRVVDQPGKFKTRGDYGDTVYNETCLIDSTRDDMRPATIKEYKNSPRLVWGIWDGDYGWFVTGVVQK
jgi:hypothetical protein